jgi:hypothetical protein
VKAHEIAAKASDLVGGDRDGQHGRKLDNFKRIAAAWDAWINRIRKPGPIDAHDVGAMMALLKMARTQSGSLNMDDYIDAAGYAACAGEVAHELSQAEAEKAGSMAETIGFAPGAIDGSGIGSCFGTVETMLDGSQPDDPDSW